MKMNSKLFMMCLLCAAMGFSSGRHANCLTSNASVELPQQDQIAKESWNYKQWPRVNAKPFKVEAGIAAMCAPASQVRNISPHQDKYIFVYVNGIGRNAMMTEKYPQFPQGSEIVKEKLVSENKPLPEMVTGMIKREKGFNPATNDWEFYAIDLKSKTVYQKDEVGNCIACHTAKRGSDFVFRNYLSNDVQMKLKD